MCSIIPFVDATVRKEKNRLFFYENSGYDLSGNTCVSVIETDLNGKVISVESIFENEFDTIDDFHDALDAKCDLDKCHTEIIIESYDIDNEEWTSVYVNWGDMTIVIENGGERYIVYKNSQIVEEISDEDLSLQLGDAESLVHHLPNGNLLIRNCGDVNSCLLFSKLEEFTEIHHKVVVLTI